MRKERIYQIAVILITAILSSSPVTALKNETVPTMPPSDKNTTVPTPAPTPNSTTVPTTAPPVDPPTMQPTKKYVPPVTAAPTTSGEPTPDPPQHTSIGRMIARTIGWLIILALSVLCFGSIMSNRYRFYYFLRGAWYAFLRLECTRWIIRKVRFGNQGPSSNQSLNEIIFDQQDLNEGLLLNSNQ